METQENSVDPVLQTLSQSNSHELAEVVKQNDPNVSTLLIRINRTIILTLSGCSKGHGSAGRWLSGPRQVAQESSTSSQSEELRRGNILSPAGNEFRANNSSTGIVLLQEGQ